MEAAADQPRGRVGNRQLDHSALHLPVDPLVRHEEHLAVAVGEIQQRSVQRAPLGAVDPQQLGRRAVEAVGDPAQRLLHRLVRRVGDVVVAVHVAVEAAFGLTQLMRFLGFQCPS